MTTPDGRWWGDVGFAVGATTYFRIGPLDLFALRRAQEWRFAVRRDRDPLDPRCERDDGARMPPAEGFEHTRVAVGETAETLVLTPALADRNVVVRPEVPFRLLPGKTLTLFVSTPSWIRLTEGASNDNAQVLLEVPILHPSETWFGPSTIAGELCYSSRTAARLEREELRPRPSRIASPIVLRNGGRDALTLERLSVPVPLLSVFEQDRKLWTETLTLERHRDGEFGRISIGAPPEGARKLAGPRVVSTSGGMLRAVTALWS